MSRFATKKFSVRPLLTALTSKHLMENDADFNNMASFSGNLSENDFVVSVLFF